MPQQQQEESSGMREAVQNGYAIGIGWSVPWRLMCSVGGSVGYRQVGNFANIVGLAIVAVFALVSQVMSVVLVLACVSQLEHRAKSRRAKGVHSNSIGVSHLERRWGKKARLVEVMLALVIGMACFSGGDTAAAIWFCLAGLGHAMTVGFIERRQREVEDDINDAQLEMKSRSYRQEATRVVKPWDVR